MQSLRALGRSFHVTFLTFAPEGAHSDLEIKLKELCDEVLILPSFYNASVVHRLWHHARGAVYAMLTGLKASNYAIGKVEFSPERIAALLHSRSFDLALYEYWHAEATVPLLKRKGIRCVLDMHDILWQGRLQRLQERTSVPAAFRNFAVARYRAREEKAWRAFDAIVAINQDEQSYVRERVAGEVPVFYAPMGTDLSKWEYRWSPADPPRIAYYGALGNAHNQRSALQCYSEIMPNIWTDHPHAQLWLIGSKPSEELLALADDPRVVVTGFVRDVQEVLCSMTVVLCPWKGTYGFRSRLVEVMATGVPVVASPDAVAGMGMQEGEGLFLAENSSQFAQLTNELLRDRSFLHEQSLKARAQMEKLFSLESTYHRLTRELLEWFTTVKS